MTATREQDATAVNSSVTELIAGIAIDMRELAAAHAAQMQVEMRAELAAAKIASEWLIAGWIAMGVGLGSLLVGLGMLLVEVGGWSVWASAFTVGAFTLVAGVALYMIGVNRMSKVNVVPAQSLNSLQESFTCLAKSAM